MRPGKPRHPSPARSVRLKNALNAFALKTLGARIDELRVGGETQSIDVKPKGGMPAYQIHPSSGERSWKVLGF
jgi:hypothetical protein